jgi:signal transduction histidine kinase
VGTSGDKGKISISAQADATHAIIRISDTGTGIPEQARPKIFDPFFTTKEVGKGTGQGLAMAWSTIVERHHGSIVFETELGVGTTFIIRLPLCAAEQDPSGVSP